MSKTRHLVRLILDFDGTLTIKDTLHVIAQAGYNRQQQRKKSTDPPASWQSIVNSYVADFTGHSQSCEPHSNMRKTIEAESAWLNSLRSVEAASAQRVYDAGIFNHVTTRDMHEAAEKALENGEVQLRPGWAGLMNQVHSLFKKSTTKGATTEHEILQIVSVNWSRSFICSMLEVAAEKLEEPKRPPPLAEVAIYANEIPSVAQEYQEATRDESLQPRGSIKDLRVSEDKMEVLLLETQKHAASMDLNVLTIYIGDSATDLQCLLCADVGICVRDEPMSSSQKELSETLRRLQIPLKHISGCSIAVIDSVESSGPSAGCIWWCKDFHEVNEWLKGVVP